MHDLRKEHVQAVYRILRYLNATPGKGILFRGGNSVLFRGGNLEMMEAYTDADNAGSLTNRRSTTGYCVFLGGN